jgi:hypothetical protein
MGYNPREHACELFAFECMRKNDKCLSCEIFLTSSGYRRIQDPTEIKH